MIRVAVGISGGVDSTAAVAFLKEEGYEPIGVFLKMHDQSGEEAARQAAQELKIPFHMVDLTARFEEKVLRPFAKMYKMGQTPNPCVLCNPAVKFAGLMEAAKELGCARIATGHYAQIQQQNGRYLLQKPRDLSKDQTYVLYSLTQKQLSKTFFPLGGLTKNEVREFAAEHGFVNANKKDSQDICFVPDGDYVDFIARTLGVSFDEGDFVDLNRKIIGRHKGMIRYTIGQRKGLGMGFGRPMYVVGKEPFSNRVILGEEKDLYQTRVLVKDMNYIAFDRLEGPLSCLGKLRYRQSEQPCRLIPLDETIVLAEFDTPQRAVTAGQAAVFYDGNTVIGGGTIWEE